MNSKMKKCGELEAGEKFGPLTITINEDTVNRIEAVDDDGFWREGELSKRKLIDPTILVQYSNLLKMMKCSIAGLVHIQQKIKYHKIIKVGDIFKASGQIISKFNKNGKRFLVFQSVFLDEIDKPVLESIETYLIVL